MKLRWILGVFAFGSLVACMVPDVTSKSGDNSCSENSADCGGDAPSTDGPKGTRSSPLTSTTGEALPASDGAKTSATPVTQSAHADAGADASTEPGTSTSSGSDDSDAGTTDTTTDAPACDKLLDCCAALRAAGNDADADACDATYTNNDDLACFDAQDGYANPTDGTTGVCDQP